MTPVEVVGFADVPWESLGEHREYHLRIKTMLRGREGTLDNFRITYSEGTGGIQKGPRHRHTFDQIRMPFSGRTSIGSRRWLQPGEIGYFPEGVHYGPTVDEMDVGHTQITLQFGGASGLGFMSGAEIRNATKELEAVGTFEKGLFRRADGDPIRGRKVQDAFEAIWEHFYKRRIVYPAPRYADQIVMRPANFAWEPHPDAPGVLVKPLGDFTERHLTVSMLRVEPGHVASLGPRAGTLAAFVLSGTGSVAGKPVSAHSAVKVDAGAVARLESADGVEAVVFGLPIFAAARAPQRELAGAV